MIMLWASGRWSQCLIQRRLFSADILADEFVEWVENSYLLKRAFREVAIISGLVERNHPGKRKIGAASDVFDRPDLRRAAQV